MGFKYLTPGRLIFHGKKRRNHDKKPVTIIACYPGSLEFNGSLHAFFRQQIELNKKVKLRSSLQRVNCFIFEYIK